MLRLNEDLKNGKTDSLYLLYGEEAYLKRQYLMRIKAAIVSDDDSMNYAYYEGGDIDVDKVTDLARTLPFFAEKRLIVMEDTGFFKGAATEKLERLASCVKTLPKSTVIAFSETEVDRRSGFYKTVSKAGRAVEMKRQDESTLTRWVAEMAKREKIRMPQPVIRLFLGKTGNDMYNINREMQKLIGYTAGRDEITARDVDEVCSVSLEERIFDMADRVAEGKTKEAVRLYRDLLELREPPMRVLFMLTRQFRMILKVKEAQGRSLSDAETAAILGLKPFLVARCRMQAEGFSKGDLETILEDGAATEEDIKNGNLQDTIGVELFIVKNSSGRTRGTVR